MVVLEQRICHTASDMRAKPQELGEGLENHMFQRTHLEVAVFLQVQNCAIRTRGVT